MAQCTSVNCRKREEELLADQAEQRRLLANHVATHMTKVTTANTNLLKGILETCAEGMALPEEITIAVLSTLKAEVKARKLAITLSKSNLEQRERMFSHPLNDNSSLMLVEELQEWRGVHRRLTVVEGRRVKELEKEIVRLALGRELEEAVGENTFEDQEGTAEELVMFRTPSNTEEEVEEMHKEREMVEDGRDADCNIEDETNGDVAEEVVEEMSEGNAVTEGGVQKNCVQEMDQRSGCDVDEEAALEMSDGEDRGKQGHFTAGDQVEMEVEANEKEDGGGDGESLNTKHKRGDKLYICKIQECGKKFGTIYTLDAHTANVHRMKKPFFCKVKGCTKKFGSKGLLDRHMIVAHKGKGTFKCTAVNCTRKFGYKCLLEEHQCSEGHGLKQFKCDQANCTLVFSSSSSLSRHRRFVHKKEKPVSCLKPGCGKKFKTKEKLENHLRSAHDAAKLACKEADCAAVFSRKEVLEEHIRYVHGAAKLACKEADCTAVFSHSKHLQRHKRFVHLKEKPVSCLEPDCGGKFRVKQELEDHLRSAHGAAKLTCKKGNCTATFVHFPTYYQHMKKKH